MDRKLQVFVSSTYTDLQAERQAAVSAILMAGHMPAGMELFTAGNQSQWDTITKWIDDCDVYLLILGGRYGSIEDSSQLSYIELEYDYALRTDKPLFAVVAKEEAIEAKVRRVGTAAIEQDHPSKLRAFRKKVLSNISQFFEDEKDIRLAIMESLPRLSITHAQAGWVRAKTVVDTKSLDEAIVRLREENIRLEAALSKANRPVNEASEDDFEKLRTVLNATLIETLPDANNQTENRALLAVCKTHLDTLVKGLYSAVSDPELSWLYHVVFPKLLLHGLASNERPEKSTYFRSKLNSKGLSFFSRLQMEELSSN